MSDAPKPEALSQAAVHAQLVDLLEGVHVDASTPDFLYFVETVRKLPFAKLKSRDDADDRASGLDAGGACRLDLAISKGSFENLFPPGSPAPDFTTDDELTPHPIYGRMHWVSVRNPSQATFERLLPLVLEAYAQSVGHAANRRARWADQGR